MMVWEQVTDARLCPTCGHCHPNGIGAGWCVCRDCSLFWTNTPRYVLAPDERERLEELERRASGQGGDSTS